MFVVAMQDLIKYTPTGHADYDQLQKTLKLARHFLDKLVSPDAVRDNVCTNVCSDAFLSAFDVFVKLLNIQHK